MTKLILSDRDNVRKMIRETVAIGVLAGDIIPQKPQIRQSVKIGRNDPCPCGSGKKYKRCHYLLSKD
jgi:uncharacterized protein YecA (UPF0149 family)